MADNETIADIIAEKRRQAEHIRKNLSTVPVRKWDQEAEIKSLEDEADRLEAALGRGKSTAEKSSAVGNVAKLREALVDAKEWLTKCLDGDNCPTEDDIRYAIDGIGAALAAPPRNCDRPECATAKAAQNVWRKEDGGKTAYYEWLFSPATEQKGGAK